MDSINLSETQKAPLNFRSTASNTNSFPCFCCNLKGFPHIFPQGCCSPTSTSGQSKCKQGAEEEFPMCQFLPSFPLIPNFYCNTPFPNLYAPQNHTTGAPKNEQEKQAARETENPFYQATNSTTVEEDCRKNNVCPEIQYLGHPQYFPNMSDLHFNSFQRCCCSNSFPWSCTPFIVPVVSYCVLWNSRKPNILTGCSQGTCQLNTETAKHPDAKEIHSENVDLDPNNNSERCRECLRVTLNEWTKEKQMDDLDLSVSGSVKSTTLISSDSVKDSIKNAEQMEKNGENLESGSYGGEVSGEEEDEEEEEEEEEEEDVEDTETCDSEYKEINLENLSQNENDITIPKDIRDYIKSIESQPPSASESDTELKEANLEKNDDNLTEFNPPDNMGEGENVFHSRTTNNEENPGSQNRTVYYEKPIFTKKFINNFTMTDKTIRHLDAEESHTSAAAAGDLGGVNCMGYRVNIVSPISQEHKIGEETQTVGSSQSKESIVKASEYPEETKGSPQTVGNRPRQGRHFKSGIAKLLNTSKLKETKEDTLKNTRNVLITRGPSQKEPTPIIRKRNCGSMDGTSGTTEQNSKINRTTRNYNSNQRPTQGSEKQQKTTTCRRIEMPRTKKY